VWPWGVVLLTDSASTDALPTTFADRPAVGADTAVAYRIQHEIDGPALAEVWLDSLPDGMTLVHEQQVRFPSGLLLMGDAASEEIVQATIDPGPWNLKIFVDDVSHPEVVVAALTRAMVAR
jgi:hypothetical protein